MNFSFLVAPLPVPDDSYLHGIGGRTALMGVHEVDGFEHHIDSLPNEFVSVTGYSSETLDPDFPVLVTVGDDEGALRVRIASLHRCGGSTWEVSFDSVSEVDEPTDYITFTYLFRAMTDIPALDATFGVSVISATHRNPRKVL